MFIKIFIVISLSVLHIVFGMTSFLTGISSSIQSLIWMAHTVSPMWSGAFFIITGCTGLVMCKQRSQYSILCFTALNSVTLITAVVNMQLLRLGLVNHTTLGRTFQKENKDVYIIIGMCVDGCEFFVCVLSLLISVKLNHDAKNNRFKSHRKEGAFFVQIVSDKDIVVVKSKQLNAKDNNAKPANGIFNKKTISYLINSNNSHLLASSKTSTPSPSPNGDSV